MIAARFNASVPVGTRRHHPHNGGTRARISSPERRCIELRERGVLHDASNHRSSFSGTENALILETEELTPSSLLPARSESIRVVLSADRSAVEELHYTSRLGEEVSRMVECRMFGR